MIHTFPLSSTNGQAGPVSAGPVFMKHYTYFAVKNLAADGVAPDPPACSLDCASCMLFIHLLVQLALFLMRLLCKQPSKYCAYSQVGDRLLRGRNRMS